jgi:hypothetical protein
MNALSSQRNKQMVRIHKERTRITDIWVLFLPSVTLFSIESNTLEIKIKLREILESRDGIVHALGVVQVKHNNNSDIFSVCTMAMFFFY